MFVARKKDGGKKQRKEHNHIIWEGKDGRGKEVRDVEAEEKEEYEAVAQTQKEDEEEVEKEKMKEE